MLFLNNCGLCNLHTATNHETLPLTCQLYPRFINNFGGYEERGLSFSCEAAAKIIANNKLNLVTVQNEEPIVNFTSVDAELFCTVKCVRNYILQYINNFCGTPNELCANLIVYAENINECINNGNFDLAKSLMVETAQVETSLLLDDKLRVKAIKSHLKNKILRASWKTSLKTSLNSTPEYNLENLKIWLSYFVFRYLINAAFNKRVFSTIRAGFVSYMIIEGLEFNFIDSARIYSKETEHNKYNICKLFKI